MGINDSLIKQLRLKIALLLALRYELIFFTILGFLLGVIILVVRVIFMAPRQELLWVLICLPLGTIWAITRAVKETPPRKALSALFDEKNHCGGLLMTSEEISLGSWQQKLPAFKNLTLKWHGAHSFGLSVIAVIFLVVSFLVPQRYVNIAVARPLNIDKDVERLQQQIDILEEENVISEEVAQEFEQKLEQLRDTTSGYDPVKTWEALDHLQQSVEKQADQFTAKSLSQTESLAQTQTLAQGLSENGIKIDSNLLSEAMTELSVMVQSCVAQNELLKNNLGTDCINACKKGALSAEQLKELLKALKENKANISTCLARLYEAELVDMDKLKLCEKLGTCNSKDLIAFLNENADRLGMCNAVSLYCQCPGRGGVSRGRGDAQMTWTDGSAEEGATFREQVLPPASLAALKESMILGVSLDAPSVEEDLPSSRADALNSATAGSGEAFRHTILPCHKDTVKRYFERQ